MVVTRKLKFDSPRLAMGGVRIELSREMKLLGLTIDDGLTFNTHVGNVAAKVQWGLSPEVIRTIYVAVVEPVIMYAASAWAPAAKKLGVRKELDTVQRGFAQKLVKAYRTVSLNSALLLAGILPLDLRIQEAAALYEVKRGYSQRVVGDREVETPMPVVGARHPAEQRGVEFGSVVDGAELLQLDTSVCNIFTDGSKLEGKVGAALSLWKGNEEVTSRKFKLENFCTVYQAELLALQKATELAISHKAGAFNVYCDSRSALQTVADGTSLHPIANNIRRNLDNISKLNKIINLFWIKAHAGLEGNERADELAKAAAVGIKRRPDYDVCPVSFVKRQIRLDTIDEWNRRYQSADTGSATRMFFPDARAAYGLVRKIKMDPVLTQVFTGHGGLSEYLNRFKCKESPACPCGPEENEDIRHVLLECPRFDRERMELEFRIGVKLKLKVLPDIMFDKKIRGHFTEFAKCIMTKLIKQNKN
ncbi:hypothetical protein ABMA27_015688 [Loxostege sticticalis]|uniref:ribonuclease H n=1 Tax=Loxostege sticticalis TaxID=481309 RepID=A0ABR3I489_LOXSC